MRYLLSIIVQLSYPPVDILGSIYFPLETALYSVYGQRGIIVKDTFVFAIQERASAMPKQRT